MSPERFVKGESERTKNLRCNSIFLIFRFAVTSLENASRTCSIGTCPVHRAVIGAGLSTGLIMAPPEGFAFQVFRQARSFSAQIISSVVAQYVGYWTIV
jgi:hypothetical protein